MVRFIPIQHLEEYLAQGWVVKCGKEMATVRKDDGTTDDHVRPQE
jgi:hypothetical protein